MKIAKAKTGTVERTVGPEGNSFTLTLAIPSFRDRLTDFGLETAAMLDATARPALYESRLGLISGWSGVEDEQGQSVAFSQPVLRSAIAADPAFGVSILSALRAYMGERLSEEQVGN